ncbi:unnamed protein product [Wuchereria bancrofti]|uniref:Extracellular Endonuclease subunit A domain-containing protein n=1 Tax=Wuchereria bancrofti TaxID=6293 RepID=A0A3P7DI82_WUCBA|nr:unnamed protein product [Wuchereria bancrofti]
MATVTPKETYIRNDNCNLKEYISANTTERYTVKLPKVTLFSAGYILSLFIAVIIIFGCLRTISTKLSDDDAITQSSNNHSLDICEKKFNRTPLLILSFDGFRNSYLEHNITPSIQRLINYGTHSKYMLPTFPSKTFPNHYTIATGLYPAWHGIVDNRFYDRKLKAFFKKSSNKPGWYLGEPIWKTAQKAGLKSAVFFWPGSEELEKLPNYWMKYNSSTPFRYRIDTVIKWLKLPDDERPSLIQAYFEEPDLSGHKHGPNSQAVHEALILMDGVINYLIKRLLEEKLMGCINLILLSDHGMQQMDKTKFVVTTNYSEQNFDNKFFSGATARIQINYKTNSSDGNGIDDIIDDVISTMECQSGNNYLAYRKDLVPIRFHYADSPRIGDVIIKGRPGVCIFQTDEKKESYNRLGDHGYDNRIVSMRTIFIAIGPDIAQNRKINSFQNIELYNLFAYLLRIDAAPNNGTNGTLFTVLRNPPTLPITAVDQQTDQCTDKIKIKKCDSSCDCQLMNENYCNCTTAFNSSISASYQFTGELCSVQLCDAFIHFDKKLQKTVIIEGIMKNSIWLEKINESCVTCIDIMQNNSHEIPKDGKYSISLFGNLDHYYMIDLARVIVPKIFVDRIWRYVLNETAKYLAKYDKLRFFSGVAYDQDGDGVRDSDDVIKKSDPSHLFFVPMWCENSTLIDHISCKDIIFIPYILPLKGKNLNCLEPSEYLYDNTARMRDIELLTGMEFFTDRNIWSDVEAIQLRTLLRTQ